jgi:hypothetical protein
VKSGRDYNPVWFHLHITHTSKFWNFITSLYTYLFHKDPKY